jgi:hypothetical protein
MQRWQKSPGGVHSPVADATGVYASYLQPAFNFNNPGNPLQAGTIKYDPSGNQLWLTTVTTSGFLYLPGDSEILSGPNATGLWTNGFTRVLNPTTGALTHTTAGYFPGAGGGQFVGPNSQYGWTRSSNPPVFRFDTNAAPIWSIPMMPFFVTSGYTDASDNPILGGSRVNYTGPLGP